MDPFYFDYQGCICERGTYGSVPNCLSIPATTTTTVNDNTSVVTFSPAQYGNQRQMVGMDTAWLISPPTGLSFPFHSHVYPSIS
jgi:hypothetical protein